MQNNKHAWHLQCARYRSKCHQWMQQCTSKASVIIAFISQIRKLSCKENKLFAKVQEPENPTGGFKPNWGSIRTHTSSHRPHCLSTLPDSKSDSYKQRVGVCDQNLMCAIHIHAGSSFFTSWEKGANSNLHKLRGIRKIFFALNYKAITYFERGGPGDMAQSSKCLPHKHQDLSSVPRIHIKKKKARYGSTCL